MVIYHASEWDKLIDFSVIVVFFSCRYCIYRCLDQPDVRKRSASEAITAVDNAINRLSSQRANLGALHNRLEFKISNLDTIAENLTAAESRIRDVDYAKEIMEFTRYQILTQVSMAIMAQANALPQTVLKLFENL